MENELKLKDVKRYWYNNNNIMDPNSWVPIVVSFIYWIMNFIIGKINVLPSINWMPHLWELNYWDPQYYSYKNVINQSLHHGHTKESMKSLLILGTSICIKFEKKKKRTEKGEWMKYQISIIIIQNESESESESESNDRPFRNVQSK